MTTETSVRPMVPGEAEEVAALLREVVSPLAYYSEEARRSEIAKYTPESLAAMSAENPNTVLVAVVDGRVGGFCISRYDDGIVWLAWFGVADRARGRGVGEALLRALEESTRARGIHKVWCDTRTDNLRSQRVLERTGFTRICEIANHWYGQDFILWQKPLLP